MHHAALKATGLAGDYTAIKADRARLSDGVDELKSGGLDGCNVTMPLKRDAFVLCDVRSGDAERAGSVNSLRCRRGEIQGHNTDVVAFRELLDSERFLHLHTLLIIGAGGSARAGVAAALDREVYVTARSREKVDQLGEVTFAEWGEGVPGALVINATPLGMKGEDLPEGLLEAAGGLIDLPYGDRVTPSVGKAGRADLPVADGLEFLARQARASFQWWTGRNVELNLLMRAGRNV